MKLNNLLFGIMIQKIVHLTTKKPDKDDMRDPDYTEDTTTRTRDE